MMKLVGYRKGISKKGSAYCMMNILTDPSEMDRSNGQIGQKTEEIFLPSDLVDMLKPSDVGHEVICDYSISGGRAFLDNVTIK